MNDQQRTDRIPQDDIRFKPPRLLDALGLWGQIGVVLVGLAWLALFTGGLTIATEPYRTRVSPMGAAVMADTTVEAVVSRSRDALGLAKAPDSVPPTRFEGKGVPSPWRAAIMVALFFTPTNVALLSILAGMLGAFGARSNLRSGPMEPERSGTDAGRRSRKGSDATRGRDVPPLQGTDPAAGNPAASVTGSGEAGTRTETAGDAPGPARTAGTTTPAAETTAGGVVRAIVHVDNVNPYLSGVLRGFFVYLAVISGLLVLLGNPFQNITPFSYIRFAGLLSLFSFTVSYNPDLFSAMMQRARDRVREGAVRPAGDEEQEPAGNERE